MRYFFCLVIHLLIFGSLDAQKPQQKAPGEIFESIKKLNILANALFVAAHPDDENQRLISYLSNYEKANTTYLSLTRGDGGQNIVGTEIKEQLGVIRTQELLAARRVDGGNQTFTRAIDFGFSKHPDETLRIWNKEEVLSDVVWAIRKYRPDVIINRFDHRTPGKTHGHHTSSAMLAFEAFDMTGDKTKFPDQLQYVDEWQAKRLFFNTSWWFYGGKDKFKKADKSNLVSIDKGVYYPSLGQSNTEIAAVARSQHRSQGFGNTGVRGSEQEFLEFLKGEPIKNKSNIFDGIDITWNRVKGGAKIENLVNSILQSFDLSNPASSVGDLLELRKAINKLNDEFWKAKKMAELDDIIFQCMGLYLEAVIDQDIVALNSTTEVAIEIINRSDISAEVKSYKLLPNGLDTSVNITLVNNQKMAFYHAFDIETKENNAPYWLKEKGTLGMYNVQNRELVGLPQLQSPYQAQFVIDIMGTEFRVNKEIVYKENDRVKAEIYKPFYVVPPISCGLDKDVYIFKDNQKQTVQVKLKSYQPNLTGTVTIDRPSGWDISPKEHSFSIESKGEEISLKFDLTPSKAESLGKISPVVNIDGKRYDQNVYVIEYEYIPQQITIDKSEARVVKADVKIQGNKVGYIMGAGDKVPEAIKELGYDLDLLDVSKINAESLNEYDAVVLGIRAYNTEKELKLKQKHLFEYVNNGGTLITQYMTTWGLDVDQVGPYPLKISRERVTDETAKVRFALPDHPVLNTPNKITQKDFDGWVQERGLYFANEWDDNYDAPLSSNDAGETPKEGSLLIAEYGKGTFVYTGISWFRELPAGVPGAFKLFANLLSLGNDE